MVLRRRELQRLKNQNDENTKPADEVQQLEDIKFNETIAVGYEK